MMLKEGPEYEDLITKAQLKNEMISGLRQVTQSQTPDKRTVAFTRYADEVMDPQYREQLQFPMGSALKRIDPSKELFRVQKTTDHWEQVSRSKAFIAESFFPPRKIPLESNLQTLLAQEGLSEAELSTSLVELIPHLNHDILVELSLYLALERKLNDKEVWSAIEDAALASLHLLSLREVCQMQWASAQQKPKRTSARFNTLLMQKALEAVPRSSALDLSLIMQGFRNKASK